MKFSVSFGTTIGDLWEICGLSVAFLMRLYNSAAKIFGAEGVLRRRLEILEGKMVYTTRGSICITRVSARMYFFEKKFSRAEDCAEESPAINRSSLWAR